VTEDDFESPPSIVFAPADPTLPVVRDQEGRLHGIEAVVDKDLTAALLAEALGADALLLRTDVPAVEVDYGTAEARALHGVSVGELRAMQLPRVPWEQMSKQRAALSSGPAVRLHRLS
jgi:carbamate kinase